MNKIRKYRERAHLSLQEVGDKLEVHVTAVAQWEKGIKNPTTKHRDKLARVLGCTIYDLYPALPIESEEEPQPTNIKSPFAKYSGILHLGDAEVDCYVLDTGDRVISLSATVRAISATNHGKLDGYVGVKALHEYISYEEVERNIIEFYIPQTGIELIGKGISAETFLDICTAYVRAFADNKLATKRQREIAMKCSIIISSCAKVGLIALVDEATGYQYQRAEDALQLKLRMFIAEEMREWEKTFPDELWEELGRLTHWNKPLHVRPKWWGKLVMELVYDALDPDVAEHLRDSKPTPRHGQNYHQWLTENYGLAALLSHINQVIGIAKTCNSIQELRDQVAKHYGKKSVQMTFYYPGDDRFEVK
jgi:transcriptional regulator with XRE-family HTH domain